PYPYFVDVRGRGLNEDNPITARLPQLTLSWASPLSLPDDEDGGVRATPLLASSGESWVSDSLKVHPDYKLHPKLGFEREGQSQARVLAGVVEGVFRSYYAGKESPLLAADDEEKPEEAAAAAETAEETPEPVVTGLIDKSPESARIILVGSNDAFTDQTLQLSRAAANDRFVNSLQFMENVVDWALEDRALLSIRSRARFARTLVPMTRERKAFWEYLNYALVLAGLALVYGGHRYHLRRVRDRYHRVLAV
ncbi:MAG: ABC transporter permease, partial [Deltaproteobacteria bacterium]|nr:ABC transporter permease [Deltaproteobacteria bacterium]